MLDPHLGMVNMGDFLVEVSVWFVGAFKILILLDNLNASLPASYSPVASSMGVSIMTFITTIPKTQFGFQFDDYCLASVLYL